MCFHLDNLSDKEMSLIVAEIEKRRRQKNLYPDKKIVRPKSDSVETPLLFAINPK